jgi:cytochrome c biogenesis protein CcmG, thiol:disulfide interchange protein DsbE
VLNFFATWCPPCVAETPQLVRFAAQHPSGGGVRLVGVIHADSVSAVDAFARSHGVSWPLVEDPEGNIAAAFGLPGLPQSVVIAPDGRVVTRLTGGVTATELDQVITSGDASSQ